MAAKCMFAQVARSAGRSAALWRRALLALNVGSYGWSGHFVIFASASWRGVSHSGGVRGQVLITALCMLVRVSGIATLGWRALLARHVGSYGWSGHFVIFASASWRGVSHSGGVRGQVLITALCMLVRVSGIATLEWRALLARHVGSYGWSGHFVIFASASWRGVSHSGGVRGQVLITALCMLVRVSGIATLEWRALLARHVGSYGWGGQLCGFCLGLLAWR